MFSSEKELVEDLIIGYGEEITLAELLAMLKEQDEISGGE